VAKAYRELAGVVTRELGQTNAGPDLPELAL